MLKVPDIRTVIALVTAAAVVVQQAFPGTRYYVIAAAVLAALATHAAAPSSSLSIPALPPGRVSSHSSSAPAATRPDYGPAPMPDYGPAPMAEPRYPIPPSVTRRGSRP